VGDVRVRRSSFSESLTVTLFTKEVPHFTQETKFEGLHVEYTDSQFHWSSNVAGPGTSEMEHPGSRSPRSKVVGQQRGQHW